MKQTNEIAAVKNGAVYILQAGTPVYVKTADICSMTGKSNQWIGQLTSQGVLNKKKTACGSMYELIPNIKSYIERYENNKDQRDETKSLEIQQKIEEVKLKKAKAGIATLQSEELKGKMHRSEDVAAMTEDMMLFVRGALLSLPGRLAVNVVSAKDAAVAAEIIKQEVFEILNELSQYKYDPVKYSERVRERLKFGVAQERGENED